ncbi:MAG: trehalose-phosphatase [Acidimicrobiales bacterium]
MTRSWSTASRAGWSAAAGTASKAAPGSSAGRVESTRAPEVRSLTIADSAALELLAEVPDRAGLCCDFDGTIAPIVPDPHAARALPGALAALHGLARELAAVAVISGRPAPFLADRLELADYRSPLRAIGLHGLEESFQDGSVRLHEGVAEWRPVIETVRDQLRGTLPSGIQVEDKSYGVTAHWRSMIAPEAQLEAVAVQATEVARAVAAEHGLVLLPGKASVELALPLGIDKGTVVTELCGELERAAFLGDDAGDLFAFRALDKLRIASGLRTLKVAVAGAEVPSALVEAADLVLEGPGAAVGFLEALAARVTSS